MYTTVPTTVTLTGDNAVNYARRVGRTLDTTDPTLPKLDVGDVTPFYSRAAVTSHLAETAVKDGDRVTAERVCALLEADGLIVTEAGFVMLLPVDDETKGKVIAQALEEAE